MSELEGKSGQKKPNYMTQNAMAEIQADVIPKVNFAIQQSDIAVIQTISIENRSKENLESLTLSIKSEPAFFPDWQKEIQMIPAENSLSLKEPCLNISPDFMMNLTEKLKAKIIISLFSGERCTESVHEIDLLAYNEWPGAGILPELLAAFILPNSKIIEKVAASSVEILKSWDDHSGLSGYQENSPQKILRVAAAIYGAISKLDLNYSVPPASFEKYGQKVRFPEKIFESSLGTCLDLTLLLAGCLESAGLNALVIFTKGHSFVGLWLKDESFPLAWLDELLPLKKRVELKEICIFETTVLTGARSDFDTARNIAEGKLNQDEFIGLIDIKRSRSHDIRPMPLLFDGGKVKFRVERKASPDTDSCEQILPPIDVKAKYIEETNQSKKENRIDQWKRKLLDLTLRNRLLNFKETQKGLQILTPSLGKLEDMLADGKEIKIKSIPDDVLGGRSRSNHLDNTGVDIVNEFLAKEFQQHRLYSNQTDAELTKRLTAIFRESRSSLQEGGANTLFLGAGFLNWYESETSEIKRIAPIILIPLDIKRNSVQEGFQILQRDDEAQLNVTLLELLKTDFGIEITGLDPLPLDDHGVDLDMILNTFRRSVLNISRWEVTEDAYIGLFCFQKFLMWKDLESRTEKLLENTIVNHLVNGSENGFPNQGDFPSPEDLDRKFSLKETFCPLSADSSQLTAVHSAANGKSFVLHGPPGTGKSQTITNIISHALASGKTVLFVSEKAAALNVVFKRLSEIGLAPFCLELHSNKSRKSEVIKQLSDGLSANLSYSEEEWISQAESLERLRGDLNELTNLVHEKQALGISLFQGIGKLATLKEIVPIDLKWPDYSQVSHNQFAEVFKVIDNLELLGEEFELMSQNPWRGVMLQSWSPPIGKEVEALSQQLMNHANDVSDSLASVLKDFPGLNLPKNFKEIDCLSSFFLNLLNLNLDSGKLLVSGDYEAANEKIQELVTVGKEYSIQKENLLERFKEGFLNVDFESVQTEWKQACNTWWPKSWFNKRAVYGRFCEFLIDGKDIDKEKLPEILEQGLKAKETLINLREMDGFAQENLGILWKKENSDWCGILSELELITKQRNCIKELCRKDIDEFRRLNDLTFTLLKKAQDIKTVGADTESKCNYLADKVKDFSSLANSLFEKLCFSFSDSSPDFFSSIRSLAQNWQENINSLRNWTLWNKSVKEAQRLGLAELMTEYSRGTFPLKNFRVVFEKSFFHNWTASIISSKKELNDFSGALHSNQIKRFQEIDEEFLNTTKKVVCSRLAAKSPGNANNAVGNSEMGILNREIRKKRKHMPLRVLFKETSNLMPRIKPCFLMSPLSVAQYLSTEQPLFDLVIFDEASQMPVWDAVGAIARGKELIVVGDPKQLPPTSFFSKSESSDWEESEFVEDLDSILEDCLAAGLPSLYLNWHYRSLHETLIAFSNFNYYDNLLHTFPSAFFEGLGLKFNFVKDGIYDKGKSRTNRIEATKIVSEVIRRLTDPKLSCYSIGIVTFNSSQQILIEDLLDEERRKNPGLEKFFSENASESLFVKNLENVQGDERDIIIFSICYGKDISGQMSMNFGPLNKSGGERRLNVAVTRARREVMVFSSILSDEIDLSRTRAVGVKHLKAYLDFALRGEQAIKEAITGAYLNEYESPFEKEVANALKEKGYNIHSQIGCAGYRVDLGVVHNDYPGKYVLGIECDGASYHSAKCARERDKLRQSVLESLGWRVYRIWSTDWWHNPERVINKTVEKIEEALRELSESLEPEQEIFELEQAKPDCEINEDKPINQDEAYLNPYEKVYVEWPALSNFFPNDQFYSLNLNAAILNLISEIVEFEGPISLACLTRKVLLHFGISRATKKAQDRVAVLANRCRIIMEKFGGEIVFWPANLKIEDYREYRKNTENSNRKAEDIPPQEVAVASFYVMETNICLPLSDLIRATANCFGFTRVGQNVESSMINGINYMIEKWPVKLEGEKVSLE